MNDSASSPSTPASPSSSSAPVTLATIAAHLGVSRSTVSNAYNHPDQLSPQLRQRILETAANLGYNGPDPVARRLRQRHAGAIGVLFSEPLHHAFDDEASVLFLNGVASAGEQKDSGLLLIPARPSQESAHVIQNAIVDGFVLYSIPPGHPFVEAALRRRLPVVCVDQTRIGGVSWVGIDDNHAARQAAQHLLDLGHRNIAILVYGLATEGEDAATPPPSVSSLRLDGYRQAMQAAGIDWSSVSVVKCDMNTPECGYSAIRSLLTSGDRPTAILCTSDELAKGAIDAARAANLDVPNDLSVVGFNDLPSASLSDPPLTTVRQPLIDKGRKAAELLLTGAAIQETYVDLEAELVIRKSTAPPAP